jgi:hypothetical protein
MPGLFAASGADCVSPLIGTDCSHPKLGGMATDQAQLADLMVELGLLKKIKDKQKRDLKITKASNADTTDAKALLDATKKTIRGFKRRRDAVLARLVRARQAEKK